MTRSDVAFLLVGILDRDDWDAGHIFPVNQLGVVISGKHVRTLPTASRSFDLISFDPTLCPLPLLFPRGLVAGVLLNVHRPPPRRFRLRSRDLAEVIPQLETLSSLGLLKVVLVAVALSEPARQTVPPTVAPLGR